MGWRTAPADADHWEAGTWALIGCDKGCGSKGRGSCAPCGGLGGRWGSALGRPREGKAAGARSSLTLARGGGACRDRSPRGAAAGASSCWPRGRRRGPARRPAPRTQDGCAGPGVPKSGGRGGYHASADGPRPSRVLVPADRATLRLWLLCKPPAIRALSHALPAGAGQEPDPERGRRGAADGREGGQAGNVFAEGLRRARCTPRR